MSGLIGAIEVPVATVVRRILQDPLVSEEVTYRRYAEQSSFSRSDGYPVTSYTDFKLTAARMKHNKRSAAVVTANVEIGDVLFMFNGDVFPSGTSLKDVIVDSDGKTYKVAGLDPLYGLVVFVSVDGG